MIRVLDLYKIVVPLFGAAYAAPNIGTIILYLFSRTNFSIIAQSSISEVVVVEVEFEHLDQYFSLSLSPCKTVGEVLEFYPYLTVFCWSLDDFINSLHVR